MNKTSNKYWSVLICLVLLICSLAVYWQVYHYDFILFDDDLYVYECSQVMNGLTQDGFIWAFTKVHAGNWHPLSSLSHMMDCQIFGVEPAWHHMTNLLFHLMNILLIFAALKLMTGALWPSVFVAAVFAIHPLHVESVAWISERKDVLCTFFWFLTIVIYSRYVKHPGVKWYLLTLLVFAMGLMAKPMIVTLPFVLLLLDYWPLYRLKWPHTDEDNSLPLSETAAINSQKLTPQRLIVEKIPLFLLAAALSVVTFFVQQSADVMRPLTKYRLIYRVENALVSYIAYIGKMLWPVGLSIFYPHPLDNLPIWKVLSSALLLVVITVFVIWKMRRYPYLIVGWLWYLGTLVPVIGFIQVGSQAMADRYTYLPSIGIYIMIGWGAAEVLSGLPYRKVIFSLFALIILLALGVTAWFQVRYWQNSVTLFRHATEVTKDNWWAHYSLAIALENQGRIREASRERDRALQINKIDPEISKWEKQLQLNPDDAGAHFNLGMALVLKGDFYVAIGHLNKALQIKPNWPEAYYYLALAYHRQGKYDLAIKNYKEVLQLKPHSPDITYQLGVALQEQGKTEQAIIEWQKALQLNPDHADAHFNLGLALAWQRRYDEAVKHFIEAQRIRPDQADICYYLGVAYDRQGKYDLAIENYNQALRLKPDYLEAIEALESALKKRGQINQTIEK